MGRNELVALAAADELDELLLAECVEVHGYMHERLIERTAAASDEGEAVGGFRTYVSTPSGFEPAEDVAGHVETDAERRAVLAGAELGDTLGVENNVEHFAAALDLGRRQTTDGWRGSTRAPAGVSGPTRAEVLARYGRGA